MPGPFNEDWVVQQGDDEFFDIFLVNKDNSKKDLTGHSVSASFIDYYGADSSERVTIGATIASPVTNGKVTLHITNSQTSVLNERVRYPYDVKLIDSDGYKNKVLEGVLIVKPSVTP